MKNIIFFIFFPKKGKNFDDMLLKKNMKNTNSEKRKQNSIVICEKQIKIIIISLYIYINNFK